MTRITIQPTFNYSLIIKSLFSKKENKKNLFMSGRFAFEHAVREILKNHKDIDKILIPTVICEEIVTILHEIGIKIEFYNINRALKIELNDIKNKMQNSFPIVLVVNYFGFPSEWKELLSLKKKNKCIFIEDNAHTLYSKLDDKELGSYGDLSFNSLRKILPLLSGSQLSSNTENIKLLNDEQHRFPTFSEFKYSIRNFKSKSNKRLLSEENNSTKYKPSMPIDIISKKIINNYKFDIKNIKNQRIENFKFWTQYLKHSNLTFFKGLEINNSICPYVFPCYAETDEIKDWWIKWGRDRNITIISWPKFHNSTKHFLHEEIMKRIICFPVNHQFDLREIIS